MENKVDAVLAFELTAHIADWSRRHAHDDMKTAIASHLVGEMLSDGESDPVTITREIQRRLDVDLERLIADHMERERAIASQRPRSPSIGTKSGKGSAGAGRRSKQRAPRGRWDLEGS